MSLDDFLAEWNNADDCVAVHTSGSTGRPKQMRVEKRRMEASARMTCDFLGLHEGDTALLCLSVDYIAGKMMVVRALTCGLRLVSVEPSSHPLHSPLHTSPSPLHTSPSSLNTSPSTLLPPPSSNLDFAAMIPMQVKCALQVPEERERLRAIRHLIIGGGAVDDELADALKDFPHAVWSTYGMTETLSHIALRRLNGPERSAWYTPFSGVGLSVNDDGCLVIDAPAVHAGTLVTNDVAELRADGRFRILGRRDNVVCSGGVKIQMEEVEQRLLPHVRVPFMITKAPDALLGEQVVMLVARSERREECGGRREECGVERMEGEVWSVETLRRICDEQLPKFWRPRRVVVVDQLPMTPTGKPARAEALVLAGGEAVHSS